MGRSESLHPNSGMGGCLGPRLRKASSPFAVMPPLPVAPQCVDSTLVSLCRRTSGSRRARVCVRLEDSAVRQETPGSFLQGQEGGEAGVYRVSTAGHAGALSGGVSSSDTLRV